MPEPYQEFTKEEIMDTLAMLIHCMSGNFACGPWLYLPEDVKQKRLRKAHRFVFANKTLTARLLSCQKHGRKVIPEIHQG